jgi:crossover junction endodeoxyribonuclease RuvC
VRVAGLDLSIRSTGICLVDTSLTVPIRTCRVESEPAARVDGVKPSLLQRTERLASIRARVLQSIGDIPAESRDIRRLPDLVIVEGPAIGAMSSAHDMSGNWWLIIDELTNHGVPVVEVSPAQVKQYATGSGSTSGKTKVTKTMVVEAVRTNYGDVARYITSNDEADALILAAIGCRYLGHPIESAPLPAPNLGALKKIRWPERTLAL